MSERKRFYSNPGSPIVPVYDPKLGDDGIIDLVQVGEENLQEYIDSFKEETSIDYIIAMCARGDTSVLSKRQGTFGDFSEVPKSYAEIMQKVIEGRNYFDNLPLDVRQKFDSSFEKWFMSIGEEEWYSNMGFVKSVDDEKVKVDE